MESVKYTTKGVEVLRYNLTDLMASLTLSSQDDRRFCVIDAETKRVITGREVPKVSCQDSELLFRPRFEWHASWFWFIHKFESTNLLPMVDHLS